MITIVQKPNKLNLSGNLPKFIFFSKEPISFELKQGKETLFAGNYTPGKDDKITIDVKDIVESDLNFIFKNVLEMYEQNGIVKDFTAYVNGELVSSFRVIKAGVSDFGQTAETFLQHHFLTWQVREKKVVYSSPEYLTYYAVQDCVAIIRAYFSSEDGTARSNEIEAFTMKAGHAYTMPLMYACVVGKFGERPIGYDVWVKDGDVRLSNVQRYLLDSIKSEQEEYVLFANSLGGLDSFRAYGDTEYTEKNTHNVATVDDQLVPYRIDTENIYEKNTGYLSQDEQLWLRDFFPSQQKWIFKEGVLHSITLVEDKVSSSSSQSVGSYSFSYRYTDDTIYLNIPIVRTARSLCAAPLNVKLPDMQKLILEPRLAEYPSERLTDGTLFPVQEPFAESWKTANAGGLANYVIAKINEMTDGRLLDNRFKGYFNTEGELKAKYPTPLTGESAWVGTPFPGKVYYVNEGKWVTSGDTPTVGDIDLASYYTKAEIDLQKGQTDEKLASLSNNVTTGYFIGKGVDFSTSNFAKRGFIKGHIYRIYPVLKSWGVDGGIPKNAFIFDVYIEYTDGTKKEHGIQYAEYLEKGYVSSFYEIIISQDVNKIFVGGRALLGEKVYFKVEDITQSRKQFLSNGNVCLIGNNSVYTDIALSNVRPKGHYRVYLPDFWELPTDIGEVARAFDIAEYYADGSYKELVSIVNNFANAERTYDFYVSENATSVKLGIRAVKGVELYFKIVDLDIADNAPFFYPKKTFKGTLSSKDGSVINSSDPLWEVTDFLPVKGGERIYYRVSEGIDISKHMVEYDENKALITWWSVNNVPREMILDARTKFIRTDVELSYLDKVKVEYKSNKVSIFPLQETVDSAIGTNYRNILEANAKIEDLSRMDTQKSFGFKTAAHSADIDRFFIKLKKDENFFLKVDIKGGDIRDSKCTVWFYPTDNPADATVQVRIPLSRYTLMRCPEDVKSIGLTIYKVNDDNLEYNVNMSLVQRNSPWYAQCENASNLEDFSSLGGFGINFPEEMDVMFNKIVDGRAGIAKRFHFLHISDPHGARTEEIAKFLDLSPAKFMVNTGDLVRDKFTDKDFQTPPYYNAVKDALVSKKPIYLTIGNHDANKSPSLQARFDAFIKPVNEHNGLSGNTKTYYSVDYIEDHIKCIFLDHSDGIDNAESWNPSSLSTQCIMSRDQIEWFVAQLKDAATRRLHVCCFIHISLGVVKEPTPRWFDYQVQVCTSQVFLAGLIDAFQKGTSFSFDHNSQHYDVTFEKKGDFVAWFTGHMHCDTCGWLKEYPNQYNVTVQRPTIDHYMYASTVDNRWWYVANYVTVDVRTKHLSIMRLGSAATIYGEERSPFTVIYKREYLDKTFIEEPL